MQTEQPSSLNTKKQSSSFPKAHSVLYASLGCLMVFSLMMIISSSIPFTLVHSDLTQLHFVIRQFLYMVIGVFAAFVVSKIPLKWVFYLNVQFLLLLSTILLLIITLIVGDTINGSKRWLEFGGLNFQIAEFAKFVMILFTADFVVRRSQEVREGAQAIIRMFVVAGLITLLLLLQPDFGSVVIITCCILAIFYVAGAPLGQFIGMAFMVGGMAFIAITQKEYRRERLLSFWHPFTNMDDSNYQLSRSLIAFGRGEFSGVGYGESVQKLAHLPEAHTDFVLAITGEEFGFIGVFMVIFLEALIIASIMRISYAALKRGQMRMCYTAFGIATLFFGQTIINAGMNMGLLPPKGLTMPFFSYGGSSMVVCLIMVGLVMRIDKESALIPQQECRNY